MDLKEKILKDTSKKDWEKLLKVRYVYFQLCTLFSYDYRYLYGTETEKKAIYNRKPDITNIMNYEIVCSSWCAIAKAILEEMGVSCEITHQVLPHVFLVANIDQYKIKLDPMKEGYDLTRIKIGSKSYGFQDLTKHENFNDKIKEYDNEIYGENYMYTNDYIASIKRKLEESGHFGNININEKFSNEIFNYKFDLIVNMINHTNRVSAYDDYDRYFDYLNIKLMTPWEQSKIHKHAFWQCQEGIWKIINLILIEQEGKAAICYKMESENGKYELSMINYAEMNNYVDHYEGKIKGLYKSLTQ